MKFITCLFLAAFSLLHSTVAASSGGIVFGEDHAFSLSAPTGWIMDNQAGVQQGIHAVFYPSDSTWATAESVVYSRARPQTEKISSVDAVVAESLADFHKNGSPNYKAKEVDPISTPAKKQARVFYYTGDQWGNYEAVAYFAEDKTFNFIVLNCRSKKDFEKGLPAFEAIVKSYIPVDDKVGEEK